VASLSIQAMESYLSHSISSLNRNKLHGLLAEIDFRNYINSLGFHERVSVGGWIVRNTGAGTFAHDTVVFFPNTIVPDVDYPPTSQLPDPGHGLHTICSTFHQLGIGSYFCTPVVNIDENPLSIQWHSVQLGLPTQQPYSPFPVDLPDFTPRSRRYNFLQSNTDVSLIPENSMPEEFSKEHLRVSFQNRYMAEISDIDGILWGEQYTYPIEIKEKTPASDNKIGEYFGLDVGPFVKLAFYAAKRGNLHSIFIVREINDVESRELVNWLFITYDQLAQYASWVYRGGGTNMLGGQSSVVRIPKSEFQVLNGDTIKQL